jgi:1,4-dihydroxy-6-naphthoate synthase
MSQVFTLGHTPDPDDAFMFYAMARHKIDMHGYDFEHVLEDIATLNQRAMHGDLHISAISISAYARVADKYALLPCGASMGDGYGPIVVRKKGAANKDVDLRESLGKCTIAVPGRMTSAFLSLQLFLGDFKYVEVPFDKVFGAVNDGRADAALVIHEGQLTYGRGGFEKVVDLGEWWKGETGLPLPLGGNVIRKDIPADVRSELAKIIAASIDFGLKHRSEAVDHSMKYARDMNVDLAGKFIGMYVNDFTRDYGETGREAIRRFLGAAQKRGYIDELPELEFVK